MSLFRLVRVMRILRVLRCVGPLRIIVKMVIRSLGLLAWVLVMFFSVLYVFAIWFTMGAAGDRTDLSSNTSIQLEKYYGSLWDSMFSLLMASCGVISWNELVNPLFEVNLMLCVLFFVFVFLTVFS